MFLRMVYDEGLAQAAYVIGCQATGEAIVVDPLRDVDQYIKIADADDLRIVAVAETHIHADFASGARELAERSGAHIYVSAEGGDDWSSRWLEQRTSGGAYNHTLLHDGDVFSIGGVEFRVVHTPGHTPEHIAFVVTDRGSGADAPIGVVTGDFVFVGDLGRPDLLETAAGIEGEMARSAKSLHRSLPRLDAVPDFAQVWPGHGSGSACGKALGAVPTSTLGYERRFNAALLAGRDEHTFTSFILSGQPEPPVYFARMKQINRDGPPVLGGLPDPPEVAPQTLAALDARKVAIIDTRPWDQFRAGHLPGSLSFPIMRSFSTDAGSLIAPTDDIYLIASRPDREAAIRGLIRVGLDSIHGWCDASTVTEHSACTATTRELSPAEARHAVEEQHACVLDVRRASEFAESRIPGAHNIAHTRLAVRLDDLPPEGPLLLCCRTGKRSARATAYLQRLGRDVTNIAGGIVAWPGRTESD